MRFLDIVLAVTGLVIALPIFVLVLIIGYFDTGSPVFIQNRVGISKKPFKLIKFRTMKRDTASVASHLADRSSITTCGRLLRKYKIDELPQLINVLKGDMSLVGPRPNLFNQQDVIDARDQYRVYDVLPGITGLAQIKSIDMSTPELLAQTDQEMIRTLNVKGYFKYLYLTVTGSGRGDRVR